MNVTDVLCTGKNRDGGDCTRHRRKGETTCPHHDPARVEERARALEAQAARVRGLIPAQ